MKRMTALLTLGSAGLVGLGLAMPALATAESGGSSPTSSSATTALATTRSGTAPAPLTQAQKDDILDFLADHPQLAQALATRAKSWQTFLAAHPDIKAELAKVLALPADQRRAEIQKWLAAHPDAKQALKDYRDGLREQRLTKQRDRLDRRIQRLQGGSSNSPANPSLFSTT